MWNFTCYSEGIHPLKLYISEADNLKFVCGILKFVRRFSFIYVQLLLVFSLLFHYKYVDG
jgi:hypothetical protein